MAAPLQNKLLLSVVHVKIDFGRWWNYDQIPNRMLCFRHWTLSIPSPNPAFRLVMRQFRLYRIGRWFVSKGEDADDCQTFVWHDTNVRDVVRLMSLFTLFFRPFATTWRTKTISKSIFSVKEMCSKLSRHDSENSAACLRIKTQQCEQHSSKAATHFFTRPTQAFRKIRKTNYVPTHQISRFQVTHQKQDWWSRKTV